MNKFFWGNIFLILLLLVLITVNSIFAGNNGQIDVNITSTDISISATPTILPWIDEFDPFYEPYVNEIRGQFSLWYRDYEFEEAMNMTVKWLNGELEGVPPLPEYVIGGMREATTIYIKFENSVWQSFDTVPIEPPENWNEYPDIPGGTLYASTNFVAEENFTPVPTPVWFPLSDPYYTKPMGKIMAQFYTWEKEFGSEEAINMTVRWLNGELEEPPVPENIVGASIPYELDPTFIQINYGNGHGKFFATDFPTGIDSNSVEDPFENPIDFEVGPPSINSAVIKITPTPAEIAYSDSYYSQSVGIVLYYLKKWKEESGLQEAVKKTINWLNGGFPDLPVPENIVGAWREGSSDFIHIEFSNGKSQMVIIHNFFDDEILTPVPGWETGPPAINK